MGIKAYEVDVLLRFRTVPAKCISTMKDWTARWSGRRRTMFTMEIKIEEGLLEGLSDEEIHDFLNEEAYEIIERSSMNVAEVREV
tara:strand:+ start:211 stop:465 length:255 start_codon:yes stop_codon:yes gene_type:complete